jgi:hypothetical protein
MRRLCVLILLLISVPLVAQTGVPIWQPWTSEGSYKGLHFVWLNLDNVLALMPKIGQRSLSEDAATDGRIEGAITSHLPRFPARECQWCSCLKVSIIEL